MLAFIAVVSAPLWLVFCPVLFVCWHACLAWHLAATRQSAWNRCSQVWIAAGCVYGSAVGPDLSEPFSHSLAAWFPWYHWGAREFLLCRLRDSNPLLAAYAFKCLLRAGPLTQDDIPQDVLERTDEITALRFGCCSETLSLGDYIRQYFKKPLPASP